MIKTNILSHAFVKAIPFYGCRQLFSDSRRGMGLFYTGTP